MGHCSGLYIIQVDRDPGGACFSIMAFAGVCVPAIAFQCVCVCVAGTRALTHYCVDPGVTSVITNKLHDGLDDEAIRATILFDL